MLFETFILGVLQGLTEFLPVSSSGHLVTVQHLFGIREPQILLDVLLHVATALVVIIFYRSVLKNLVTVMPRRGAWRGKRLFLLLIAGNIVTALLYFILKEPMRAAFSSPRSAGTALLLTGLVLLLSLLERKTKRRLDLPAALVAGLAQGLAIFPGLSRSGLTVVALLLLGVKREKAVEFSMLLSLPAIAGALLLELRGGLAASLPLPALALGFFTAALAGYLALRLLVVFTKRGKLHYFAPYCFVLGAIILVLSA